MVEVAVAAVVCSVRVVGAAVAVTARVAPAGRLVLSVAVGAGEAGLRSAAVSLPFAAPVGSAYEKPVVAAV